MKLLKRYKLMQVFVAIFLLSSCEEVIDIDLNSAEPVVAAEALIEKDSVAWLKLSYSSDYFDEEESEKIENAVVILNDSEGNSESLEHMGDGYYKGSTVVGKEGTTYTLDFSFDDHVSNGQSHLNKALEVYSVEFEENETPRPGEEGTYKVTLKLANNQDVQEYALVKFWANNVEKKDMYYLINDEYYAQDDIIEYNPFLLNFDKGDNVKIVVYSIDEDTYVYYSQLNDQLGGRMGASSTPYNPQSNLGDDVMGYFAAWSSTKYFAKAE